MERIIDAVPTEDIIKELTEERFVRKTNFGHNEIYIVNAHNAPNTMREIGRLREWAFRESGAQRVHQDGRSEGAVGNLRGVRYHNVGHRQPADTLNGQRR